MLNAAQLRQKAGLVRAVVLFCQLMRKLWGDWRQHNPRGQILLDFYPLSPLLAVYAYFANVLAKRHRAEIVSYKYRFGTPNGWLIKMVYLSFNTKQFIAEIRPDRENARAIGAIVEKLLKPVSEKRHIKNIHYKGLPIGESVYLTYLRRTKRSTVDVADHRLYDIVSEAVCQVLYWETYFENHSVFAVMASHDAYIEYYVPLAVAKQRGVRAYLLKDETLEFKKWDGLKSRFSYLPFIKSMYENLPADERRQGCRWAQSRLKKRLNGDNTDLYYAKSPISGVANQDPSNVNPCLMDCAGINVVIATGSPYDNPLVYGDFLFEDFYEWLIFLGGLSKRTPYSWFLKMHPWADEFYRNEIHSIIDAYPQIRILPSAVGFRELAGYGCKYILTPYGTVGHELPLLGFIVINAGNNPHVSFDFNLHPKTIEEYESALLNLEQVKVAFTDEDVFAFYYMQYHYIRNDRLVFGSSRSMSRELGFSGRFDQCFFDWFHKAFNLETHLCSIGTIETFVGGEGDFLFRSGPASLLDIVPEVRGPAHETQTQ